MWLYLDNYIVKRSTRLAQSFAVIKKKITAYYFVSDRLSGLYNANDKSW